MSAGRLHLLEASTLSSLPATRPAACTGCGAVLSLNHMVQRAHRQIGLDAAFAALADPTRRGVLEHLGRSEASVTELADRFAMTPTGITKHLAVLEAAGLVTTEKVGRVRRCRIGVDRLEDAAAWVERYQQLWDARFRALDDVIAGLRHREGTGGQDEE